MNKNLLEKGSTMPDDIEEKRPYHRYQKLGGIINEKDYDSALSRLKETEIRQMMPNESQIKQVKNMAKYAGIELGFEAHAYRTVKLYSILRSDRLPEEIKQLRDKMDDQRTSVYHDG